MMAHKTDTLHKIIDLLTSQNKQLMQLVQANNHVNASEEFNKNVTYPFTLSIISALVFWLLFSYWPDHRRKTRLRPKVELDMYHVYNALFRIFDLVMRPNPHSASDYQDQITGGLMTKELFELGLRSKCKNDFYRFYPEIAPVQFAMGKDLFKDVTDIDVTIERIFNFNSCLSVDEVLLIEKIRKKLQVYPLAEFDDNPVMMIGNQILKPKDNSMSYLRENLAELFELFKAYQLVVFGCQLEDHSIFTSEVQHYFYSGQLRKCKRLIEENERKGTSKELLLAYTIILNYRLGDKHQAYEQLKEKLTGNTDLVSYREFFKELLPDHIAMSNIKNYCSDNEIADLRQAIQDDEDRLQTFVDNAEVIRQLVASK